MVAAEMVDWRWSGMGKQKMRGVFLRTWIWSSGPRGRMRRCRYASWQSGVRAVSRVTALRSSLRDGVSATLLLVMRLSSACLRMDLRTSRTVVMVAGRRVGAVGFVGEVLLGLVGVGEGLVAVVDCFRQRLLAGVVGG